MTAYAARRAGLPAGWWGMLMLIASEGTLLMCLVATYWYLRVRQDEFIGGAVTRKLKRMKVAPASMPEREVKKIAAEMLRPA